mgnify:FL=1
MTATSRPEKVQHNVFFQLKEDVSQEQVNHLFSAIAQLKTDNKIPGILSISYGVHDSPEGLNKGFNYGLTIVFQNEAARDVYLPHPEHQKIVDMLIPLLKNGIDSVVAVDWFLTEANQV